MKRVIICILISAAMLTAGTVLHLHSGYTAVRLENRLQALESGVPDPLAEARSISAEWEEFCAFNVFLTDLEGAAEISGALVRLVAAARYDPDDISGQCLAARLLIGRFREGHLLRAENIF